MMHGPAASWYYLNHVSVCKDSRCHRNDIQTEIALSTSYYCLCGTAMSKVLYGPPEKDMQYQGAYRNQYGVKRWDYFTEACR